MDRTVASSVIVPRPGLEVKGAAGPVHSHSLPGGYSQKLGDKFAQGFCDATVKESLFSDVRFPPPVPFSPPTPPMIAAIALQHVLELVTANTSHFERVQRLGYPLTLVNRRF